MNGIILAIVGSSINFRHTNGQVVSEWPIAENARILLNGKSVGLGDLREGDQVTVSGQPAVDVVVYRDPVNQPTPPIRSPVPQDPRNRLLNTVDPAIGAQTANPESSGAVVDPDHPGIHAKTPVDADSEDDGDDAETPKSKRVVHHSSRKSH